MAGRSVSIRLDLFAKREEIVEEIVRRVGEPTRRKQKNALFVSASVCSALGLGAALFSTLIGYLAGLVVGAFSYGASLLLYIAGAQHLGAARSQILFSTAPVWGLALSWLALDEQLEVAHLVAGSMMAVAIGSRSRPRSRRGGSSRSSRWNGSSATP